MLGLYIFGGVIVVLIGALIFFRIKWGRADRAEARGRSNTIEKDEKERIDREKPKA